MIAKTYSAINDGMFGNVVEVECHMNNGLPGMVIVGLANKAIDESKERIKSALQNSDFKVPKKRITLNLAPSNIPKMGTGLDLSMAIAVLAADAQINSAQKDWAFIAELGLDGTLRPVHGILSMTKALKKKGYNTIVVSPQNAAEAALVRDIDVYALEKLVDVYKLLKERKTLQGTKKHRDKC